MTCTERYNYLLVRQPDEFSQQIILRTRSSVYFDIFLNLSIHLGTYTRGGQRNQVHDNNFKQLVLPTSATLNQF